MTEPTDAELKAMWQLHAADIGGIFCYARAVLAKWGQPAGATEEVENLRKALVYAAFALHGTPQYMLAQGITLIDGDTVRVSRDGWTVEASVNPHRQPAQAAEPVARLEIGKTKGGVSLTHIAEPAAFQLQEGIYALYTAPQPVAREPEFDQFLSDVMTAAGLVTHGKQCKQLGERLGAAVMKLRVHGIKGGQHGTE